MKNMNAKLLISLVAALGLMWSGCGDLLDVTNPNNLVSDDLGNPAAAPALADGCQFAAANSFSFVTAQHAVATDETTWTGSRDAWNQLDLGFLTNLDNEFTDQAFPQVGEARWTCDNAIQRLTAFKDAGEPVTDATLARALFYGALVYTMIADNYDDYHLSDGREAAAAVGEGSMSSLYDTAIQYLDRARGLGGGDEVLAAKARAEHAKAVWGLLNPKSGGPWVSAGMATAIEYLTAVGNQDDSMYQHEFSASTITSYVGFEVPERIETSVTADFRNVIDPVTGAKDTARVAVIASQWTPGEGTQFDPLTFLSSREMHLIVAEGALVGGDTDKAVVHLNLVREAGGAVAYDPAAAGAPSAEDVLKHERRMNLFMQMRRLPDLYRYGQVLPEWDATAETVVAPGTMFPVAKIERDANCHYSNSCSN